MFKSRLVLYFGLAVCLLSAVALWLAPSPQAALGSGAASTPNGAPPDVKWGQDFFVNPAPTFAPSVDKNAFAAVDPTNSNNAIVTWELWEQNIRNGYAKTTDAGRHWSTRLLLDPLLPDNYIPYGEPSVTYDGRGNSYMMIHAYTDSTSGSVYAYLVMTSTATTDFGPYSVAVTANSTTYQSQGVIDADKRTSGPNAGSLYGAWVVSKNVEPFWEGIGGGFSRDGGQTWTSNVQISDPEHAYASYWPTIKVASNGVVYTAFQFRRNNSIFDDHVLMLTRSTDYGVTWGQDQPIGGGPITVIGGPDYKLRERVLYVPQSCVYIRVQHAPTIAVSPTDPNTVYAMWNDGRWDAPFEACYTAGQHSDIAFSRTTDGGQTWSTPARVNDDPVGNGVDQFHPYLTVSTSGRLSATWIDRRWDPSGNFYDIAYSDSTDGGLTWSTNQRVTDVSSDPDHLQDLKLIDDLGYRNAMALGPDYAMPFWVDTRKGTQDGYLFTDRGSILVPTPTLTSTPTATPTPPACSIEFTDVPPGHTFYPFVRCLACLGIINGYQCGGPGEPCDPQNNPYFRPNNNVTRGQLSKIVSLAAGWTDPHSEQTFEDVPPGSTFHLYVEQMASRGYINGYQCGGVGEPCVAPENRPYFRPNANATRGQISKIVSNAKGYSEPATGQIFEDVPPGSTFYDFVQRLASRSIMSGYQCGGVGEPCVAPENRPYFRPSNNATRGQTAKIVSGAFFPDCNP